MLKFLVKFLSVLIICAPTVAAAQKNLKIGTYNIGMLPIGGPVPYLKERESVLGKAIRDVLDSESIDILTIQEAWTDNSVEILRNLHPDYDYLHAKADAWLPFAFDHTPFVSERVRSFDQTTGLGILIKKSLNARGQFLNFRRKETVICGGGNLCDRGVLVAQFKLNGKDWFILNSHFTPVIYQMFRYPRKKQIEELNSIRNDLLREHPQAIVVAAGDFNVSPDFGEYREGDDGTIEDWQKNASLFPLLLQSPPTGDCHDSYYSINYLFRNFVFTQDRDNNSLTALSPSTNIEPNQRIDHIIACTSQDIEFRDTKRIFEEPFQINDDLSTELSDHYGIITEILF